MPKNEVSIVVSTYGREDHLRNLVHSARYTFGNGCYEVIAVSSDTPGTKLDWMSQQPDVTTIIADQRQHWERRKKSLYAYENIGIMAASKEWVFVTNDDTSLHSSFYPELAKIGDDYDVIMVSGHLGDVGLGCRTAIIGSITPPSCSERPLYLYDFTLIRKSVYEKIGYLDEGLDWFGKGFDLAMKCEIQPGLRICYESGLKVEHAITPEGRQPPHYVLDFQYATDKWSKWCSENNWKFSWPW